MHDIAILTSGIALGALVSTIYWLRVLLQARARLGGLERDFERLKGERSASKEFWSAVKDRQP